MAKRFGPIPLLPCAVASALSLVLRYRRSGVRAPADQVDSLRCLVVGVVSSIAIVVRSSTHRRLVHRWICRG